MQTVTNIKKFKGFTTMPFRDKIEVNKALIEWRKGSKVAWGSIKRQSVAKCFKEFRDIYQPTEFYAVFWNDSQRKDHTFKIFYK